MTPPTPEELLEMVRLKKKLEEKEKEQSPNPEAPRDAWRDKNWDRTYWNH